MTQAHPTSGAEPDVDCPVSLEVLGAVYRADDFDLPLILEEIQPLQRAQLAAYLYGKSHMHKLGLKVAKSCDRDDLIRVAGEIGSSTMPHKVNPIDFENAEGNLGMANAMLTHMSQKLPISRWQRDLTDSTVLRNMGVSIGYSVLAYDSLTRGLDKLELNEARLAEDLDGSWEVLAEPIQTVMRRHGLPDPYDQLKKFTRGQPMTRDLILGFVAALDLPEGEKARLLAMTPGSYTGIGAELAAKIKL